VYHLYTTKIGQGFKLRANQGTTFYKGSGDTLSVVMMIPQLYIAILTEVSCSLDEDGNTSLHVDAQTVDMSTVNFTGVR